MFENFIEQFNTQKDELVRNSVMGGYEGFESGIRCVLDRIESSGRIWHRSWEEVLSELEKNWRECYRNLRHVPFKDFSFNMNCGEILVCKFFLLNCDTRESKFDVDVFRESLK